MIPKVIFHETAELELIEAAQYYESRLKGLDQAFITEIEHVLKQIRQNPESAPCIQSKITQFIFWLSLITNGGRFTGVDSCKINSFITAMLLLSSFSFRRKFRT